MTTAQTPCLPTSSAAHYAWIANDLVRAQDFLAKKGPPPSVEADILDELTRRNVELSLAGAINDPTDPVGRLLFNVLAMGSTGPGSAG